MNECRKQFELLMKAPPFEMNLERLTDESAWPGNYKSYSVQLAWCAWSELWGRRAEQELAASEEPVAWMHDGANRFDVIHTEVKNLLSRQIVESNKGFHRPLDKTERYTIPLFTRPQPAQWKSLTDVQWMNIVNHDHCFELYNKEEAVHLAVKMTETKIKEINSQPAQPCERCKELESKSNGLSMQYADHVEDMVKKISALEARNAELESELRTARAKEVIDLAKNARIIELQAELQRAEKVIEKCKSSMDHVYQFTYGMSTQLTKEALIEIAEYRKEVK